MTKFLSVTVILCLFVSCHSNEDLSRKYVPEEKSNVAVIPVTDYLKGQLKQIENSPVTPLKITKINGRTDSVWVTRESIRAFIAPFLTPVIDSASLTAYFDGSSFLDRTVNAFTLTYEANVNRPRDIDLKHMDIYIDPDKHTITRIYLVKESEARDTTRTLQMMWETGRKCMIRSIVAGKDVPPSITEEQMIWAFD